jgi:glucitol operon activator protein
MAGWQLALLVLVGAWLLQSVGVWMQMRYYARTVKTIGRQFDEGFLGTGYVKGRLRKGCVALVIVSRDLVVQRLALMSGRSVFARFQFHPEFVGWSRDRLRADIHADPKLDATQKQAVLQALDQIEARRRQQRKEEDPAQPSLLRPEDAPRQSP